MFSTEPCYGLAIWNIYSKRLGETFYSTVLNIFQQLCKVLLNGFWCRGITRDLLAPHQIPFYYQCRILQLSRGTEKIEALGTVSVTGGRKNFLLTELYLGSSSSEPSVQPQEALGFPLV